MNRPITHGSNYRTFALLTVLVTVLFYQPTLALGDTSEIKLGDSVSKAIDAQLSSHWSTTEYKKTEKEVRAFLIPLGAMNKVRGVWRLEEFQPVNGHMQRTTWSVTGVPVTELFDDIVEQMKGHARLKWQCESRSCGNGSEWASRVFEERLLYGRDEYMRYAVFETGDGIWVTLFCAARTADRQYIHLDIITPQPAD